MIPTLIIVDLRLKLNGGVSYATQIDNHAVTLIGSVDNLLDEEYWAVGDSYGGGNLRIGEPRTVALKVKVDF